MTDFLEGLGGIAESAAKGAAMGSVVPGIGTAIGGAAGGLIGVAMNVMPGLQHLIAGNADTVAKVEGVVQAVTGTADPAQAQAALDDDPNGIKADLQEQLAGIAADRFKATLTDVAGARQTTVDLAKENSGIAWGAPVVSLLVMAMTAFFYWMMLHGGLATASDVLQARIETTLDTLCTAVVFFWVGSNSDSRRKTGIIANSVPAQMLSKPLTSEPN